MTVLSSKCRLDFQNLVVSCSRFPEESKEMYTNLERIVFVSWHSCCRRRRGLSSSVGDQLGGSCKFLNKLTNFVKTNTSRNTHSLILSGPSSGTELSWSSVPFSTSIIATIRWTKVLGQIFRFWGFTERTTLLTA